jgi:hypothetical protein
MITSDKKHVFATAFPLEWADVVLRISLEERIPLWKAGTVLGKNPINYLKRKGEKNEKKFVAACLRGYRRNQFAGVRGILVQP